MAKYAVCGGHTILTNGYSTSANGIHNELIQDRLIRDSVIKYLRIDGNEVYDCSTPDRTVASQSGDLSYKTKKVNSYNVDLAIDIHLNSALETAVGTETFIYKTGGKAEQYAKRVNSNLVGLGFRDRGVKVSSGLAFLKNTNCTAILTECYFCSSPIDCAKADELGMDLIGKKIAEGIVGHEIKIPEPPKPIPILKYCAQIENIGWQKEVLANTDEFCGTVGQSLRLEALIVNLENSNGNVIVEGHIQNRGFQSLRNEGEVIGTIGQSLRLECIKMRLENVEGYKIQYKCHVENIGWTEWVENGAECGTTGKGLRIEAIQIRLVRA